MNKKRVCASCGFAIFGNEENCPNCGEKILQNETIEATQDKQKEEKGLIACKKCGKKNISESNFCGKCGAPLKGDVQKTKQRVVKKELSLSSGLVYSIIVLFVLLTVIIILINQKERPLAPDGNLPAQNQQMPQMQVPALDLMRVNELKTALEKNPSDKNSILDLANIYHDGNKLPEAISYYKKYLAIDEKNSDARVDMAICYFASGDNETAINELNNALKYSPKHQKAYYNLGIVSLNAGKFKESTDYFQKCYELDPKTEVGQQAKQLVEQHKSAVK